MCKELALPQETDTQRPEPLRVVSSALKRPVPTPSVGPMDPMDRSPKCRRLPSTFAPGDREPLLAPSSLPALDTPPRA